MERKEIDSEMTLEGLSPDQIRAAFDKLVPERARPYWAAEIFSHFPQLINGEIVHLFGEEEHPDHMGSDEETGWSVVAVDGPGYSTIMSDSSAEIRQEGTDVFESIGLIVADIAREIENEQAHSPNDVQCVPGKSAGDERQLFIKGGIQTHVRFALGVQAAFEQLLELHPRIRERIAAEKQMWRPVIHVGVSEMGQANDNVAMKVLDLGKIADVAVIGKALQAKDLARGFVMTSPHNSTRTIASHDNLPEMIVAADPKNESKVREFSKLIEEAKLQVSEYRDQALGQTFLSIDIPDGLEAREALEKWKSLTSSGGIRGRQPGVTRRSFKIDPKQVEHLSSRFTPPEPAETQGLDGGDAVFYVVDGLQDLRSLIQSHSHDLLMFPQGSGTQRMGDRLTLQILIEVGSHVAEYAANYLLHHGNWIAKETEFDAWDQLKIVLVRNVWERDASSPGGSISREAFNAIQETARCIESGGLTPSIIKSVIKNLDRSNFPVRTKEAKKVLREASTFRVQAGVAEYEADDRPGWIIRHPTTGRYTGGPRVGGPLLSKAARFWSFVGKRKFHEPLSVLERKRELQGLSHAESVDLTTFQKLQRVAQEGCIVIQESEARNLGLLQEKASLNDIVVLNTNLKGFKESFRLAIIPVIK